MVEGNFSVGFVHTKTRWHFATGPAFPAFRIQNWDMAQWTWPNRSENQQPNKTDTSETQEKLSLSRLRKGTKHSAHSKLGCRMSVTLTVSVGHVRGSRRVKECLFQIVNHTFRDTTI